MCDAYRKRSGLGLVPMPPVFSGAQGVDPELKSVSDERARTSMSMEPA